MVFELTFFGGVGDLEHGELGGVQCLMHDIEKKTRFLFECGQRPDHTSDYYGFPFHPKSFQALALSEFLELYPQLDGLYRHDYEEMRGRKINASPVDGIILSHAHYDHIGGIHLVRHDIPVYTHPFSKAIMWLWQYTSGGTTNQFVDLIDQFSTVQSSSGESRFVSGSEAVCPRDIHLFNPYDQFKIGDTAITPYPVDHSVPGACGFIIETSSGKIGISGDLRLRGRRRQDTETFVSSLLENKVDYLIWEGSLLHFDHSGTEEDVSEVVADLIKDKAFAGIAFPPRDLDRLASLYAAAKATKRMLVISPAQAVYLQFFNGQNGYPKLDNKYIGVYLPRKGKGVLDRPEFPRHLVERDYQRWERKFLDYELWEGHGSKKQRVTIDDIKNNQDQYLVFMPFNYMLDMLEEIRPARNSIYIRSHPGPWTPEMEVQETRQINILERFGLYDGPQQDYLLHFNPLAKPIMRNMHQVHVTGHLNRDETREILRQFDCYVIPDHCQNPQDFVNDVASHVKDKIIIPERGKKLVLK